MFKRIDNKIYKNSDPQIIAWHRESRGASNDPLIHFFPQIGDNFKNKKYFVVKDYEKALFYDRGELLGVLGGGIYQLNKKAQIKGTEIVWIDTSLLDIPWGIPKKNGILTKEGCMVGLYGDLKLNINNINTFYNRIVSGKKEWTIQDLKNWIMSLFITSLRDIFKNYSINNILKEEREKVINLIMTKITEEFIQYGLELETFNIIGMKADEDVQKLLDQDKEKTITIAGACKDKLNNLIQQKTEFHKRITELNAKKNELQNKMLNNEINKEDFNKKDIEIQMFIYEAEEDLKKIEAIIANL